MRRALTAALVAAVLAPFVPSPPATAAERSFDIYGGSDATAGEYPFFAVVLDIDEGSGLAYAFCGGAVVAPSWVLTAGHCATASDIDAVLIGRMVPGAGDGHLRMVDRVVVHPSYDDETVVHDLALLHLETPTTMRPIELLDGARADWAAAGQPANVIGVGSTDPVDDEFPDVVQRAAVSFVDDATCGSHYGPAYVAASMICAGAPALGACRGDSGGPLFVNDRAGWWLLAGTVSFGREDCSAGPGVYARTVPHAEWIRSVAGPSQPASAPVPPATPSGTPATPATPSTPSTGPAPATGSTPAVDVVRHGGENRYETARLVAAAVRPTGGRALLASGTSFPDALAASFAAGQLDTPILLTDAAALPAATRASIRELGISAVTVLGGPGAVGPAVRDALVSEGVAVDGATFAGVDRFDTAARLARSAGAAAVGLLDARRTAIVVSASSFPDALAAGPIAAAEGYPVLLTNRDALAPATTLALAALDVEHVLVVGGRSAVSEGVVSTLRASGATVTRLAGADRTATAAAVAAFAVDRLGWTGTGVTLASGTSFADALAAAPLAGRAREPLLLTAGAADLGGATRAWLSVRSTSLTSLRVLGGAAAVTPAVVHEAASLLTAG